MKRVILLILCVILTSGCTQTMLQRHNILNAINEKSTPVNYNKTYIVSTFGYPDSQTNSVSNGVCTEKWTYKTKLGTKELLFDMRPHKTRSMTVTMQNNIVTDVSFE